MVEDPVRGAAGGDPIAGKWIGVPRIRIEDPPLLRGEGKYVDDLRETETLEMLVVRSTLAHGRILNIDLTGAASAPGVVAAFDGRTLAASTSPFPIQPIEGTEIYRGASTVMAIDKVRYVGEPVAVLVGLSRSALEDAAELVDIEFSPLTPVGDLRPATGSNDVIHEGIDDNLGLLWRTGGEGVDEAFEGAHRIVEVDLQLPRLAAAPIEPRGCVASWDGESGRMTLWVSAQDPHRPRRHLAEVIGLKEQDIRVIVPEVGGAFGSKGALAPEVALTALASMELGRPIRWIETRTENIVSSPHGRGSSCHARLALSEDGTFLALDASITSDLGAAMYPTTAVVPTTAGSLLTGVYRIPAARVEVRGYFTNRVPTGPYRGAGRPEACYFIESLVDVAAAECSMSRSAIRRQNLIRPEDFPYAGPLGFTYDSGNYPEVFDRMLDHLHAEVPATGAPTQERSQSATGFAMYVERAAPALWEMGGVEIDPDGIVRVKSGSNANGQGHRTSFSQIVAEELGVDISMVEVHQGDSDLGEGVGTFGSRSMTVGGEALVEASQAVIAQALEVASRHWEIAVADLTFDLGVVAVVGSPERRLSLFDLAAIALEHGGENLAAVSNFHVKAPVFPYGAYAATVRVGLETGRVEVLEIVAIDDAGRIVNPLLAEGQVIGSTLQGVSSAIFEAMLYDDDQQPLTSNLMDYAVPAASEAGYTIVSEFFETRTPYTQLGAKGVGEAGTIGALAAVANAVNAALRAQGCSHLDPPYSPARIWATMIRGRRG